MDAAVERAGDKTQDSTPGLLMKIVRRLLFSCDVGQREQEKCQLEKQFQQSDQRLDALVADHLSDVMLISQTFSIVSSRISVSQERIRAVKESLSSCKNLLHCKRDELRRLWIEGVEMKAVYCALDAVEQVVNASERLPVLISNHHYLTCTQLLVSALTTLDTQLTDVEALQQMRLELGAKKDEVYDQLITELHRQIYVHPASVILRSFQRDATQRQSRDRNYVRASAAAPNAESDESALRRLMEVNIASISSAPRPSADPTDPDTDPVLFIAVIVESLGNLRRLPDAVDALRSYVRPGLVTFIQQASQHIADGACIDDGSGAVPVQPQLLLELLELVWRQCRVIARGHAIILANMHSIKSTMTSHSDFCLYDLVEVWNKIQAVLQEVIADYLDIHNTSASVHIVQPASLDETQELAAYFGRRRPARAKKFALFRFDSSSHAVSMNSYTQQQFIPLTDCTIQAGSGSGDVRRDVDQFLIVCRRCPHNVTTIYNPLQKYLQEIATATDVQPSAISLHAFIRDFVRNVFLSQVQYSIEASIADATRGISQHNLIDLHTQRELGFPKPLLKSTVQVARSIQELCALIHDLPDYADQFVNMICKILQEYLDICHNAYQDYVSGVSDDRRITSASWVKDDDINRLLRSLPNWQRMKAAGAAGGLLDDDSEEAMMSDDDLHQMNSKESSILTSNLSTSEQREPQVEIITDTALLRSVGNLCESMEWFSQRIDALVLSLMSGGPACILPPPDSSAGPLPVLVPLNPVSDSTTTTLRSLARHFADINEQCSMLLHVEVRMHCFQHLLPISVSHTADYHGVIDKMEPDENVMKLNKDLTALDEVLQQSIQPRRFRYVFEGLGHLVSTILINTAQFLKRINENGIKKMCRNIFSLQQCLTNITMNRESDLDHARQYYELVYLPPDEILKAIVDRGRQFTEQEYIILISLSHRSEYGSTDTELTARLRKLRTILTECGASSSL
jgi:exocyst complex component 4